MGSKMLIDSSHGEETRVVVARGTKIDEFDFESATRKPLKGNIYLAKVTRVEPSLQAAFVEYGGNRHGFLAFAEIHPDYYQIPIADRLALIKEQEEEEAAAAAEDGDADDDDHDQEDDSRSEPHGESEEHHSDNGEEKHSISAVAEPAPTLSTDAENNDHDDANDDDSSSEDHEDAPESGVSGEIESVEQDAESQQVDSVGAEDALEEVPRRQRRPQRRRYKIQEVIKRRQILLVQVVKEERGNKGAALTTYLSLAGRYCVLMPNTARGGGISRKITDNSDRRRLKEVARDIEVPQGMGLIVRTAGAQRTRPEIKRDFDYLLRLWESVRTLTLQSQAPSLVYEEGSLIKRSIRDLYTKEVTEVVVEGEEAYREAKDFMKMLMPSHAKNVKLYKEPKPLFSAHHVEHQLDALFSPTVTLPSGGYLVLNQTEALVSIDINSGKSTREHSIEDTALRTNLEACDEIARQLRLRDLAGLIVIDFIDMDENRNNRSVERRMKEALKNDRARIQVGRISHFGLLEMSRQRLRPGLLEGAYRTCPHCEGRGIVRSIPSCGLGILRNIEEQLQKRAESLTVKCTQDVAFYLLNEKRDSLLLLETTYGVTIFIVASHDAKDGHALIERTPNRAHPPRRVVAPAVQIDSVLGNEEPEEEEIVAEETEEQEPSESDGEEQSTSNEDGNGRNGRRRRRRGRRGRGNRPEGEQRTDNDSGSQDNSDNAGDSDAESKVDHTEGDEPASSTDDAPSMPDRDEQSDGDAESDATGGEGRRERGKGRFGRRGRRDRNGRGDRERGNKPERADRPPRDSGDREQRAEPEFKPLPPSPKIEIPEFIAEPEPRKWQPPAPTVAEAPAERKAGWWSKRK
jgi:ribonuclease E